MSNSYFVGIDAGSTYIKVAIIKDNSLVDTAIGNTGINNNNLARQLLDNLITKNGIKKEEVKSIFATGYSRKILDFVDNDISEITAHAYGSRLTSPENVKPKILIDIGGQDSKVIQLNDDFTVKSFVMNDKCAAGTGKFLETSAQILETTIDQIGPLSIKSKNPCSINSTCVVFAQSEIISLIARNFNRNDILYGLHLSFANRISKMIRFNSINDEILLLGGGGLNVGLKRALEEELLRDIYVSTNPQFNGAIGAALFAKDHYE